MRDAERVDVDVAISEAWEDFTVAVEDCFMKMSVGVALTVHVPVARQPVSGHAPYLRILRESQHAVTVVVSGNHHLAREHRLALRDEVFLRGCRFQRPADQHPAGPHGRDWWQTFSPLDDDRREDTGAVVTEVLRHLFRVLDPALLTVEVCPEDAAVPALVPGAPREDRRRFPKPPQVVVESAEQMSDLVAAALSHHMDAEVDADSDGDFSLVLGGCPFWVRASRTAPCLEIEGILLLDTGSAKAARKALRRLNREAPLGFLHIFDGQVRMCVRFPAVPFVAESLYAACGIVDVWLDHTLPGLVKATGGRRAEA